MYKLQKTTRKDIDDFLHCKVIAVAGASRNEKSFSTSVITHLRSKGYEIFLINPNFDESNPAKNELKTIAELPEQAKHLLVLTSPSQTASVVKQAIAKGISHVWIQQKSETPEAILLRDEANLKLVSHHCIFMFSQAEGMHKFHYNIKRFFGKLPA